MDFDADDNQELVSKTRRKKDMLALQDLGKQLTEIPESLLEKCNLPDDLLHAIHEYKRIPERRGARKRQLQFIGKVMRDVDVAPIRKVLDEEGRHVELEKRRFHRLEEIRELLLTGDQGTLDELITRYPGLDIQYVRQLVRQAAREAAGSKAPAASRKLFTYLRDLTES